MRKKQTGRLDLRLTTFKLGLLVTLVFVAIKYRYEASLGQTLPFLSRLENAWLDGKFLLRGPVDKEAFRSNAHVVIAAIDEKSLRQPDLGLWPWPRAKVATLVEQLNRCGAKAVGFDVVFAEPDASRTLPVLEKLLESYKQVKGVEDDFYRFLKKVYEENRGDSLFAEAIEEMGRVVLGYFFFLNEDDMAGLGEREKQVQKRSMEDITFSSIEFVAKGERLTDAEACSHFLEPVGVRVNMPEISASSDYHGFFNFVPELDRIYRSATLVMCLKHPDPESEGGMDYAYLPSLSLKLLSLWYQQPIELLVGRTPDVDEFEGFIGVYLGPLGMPGPDHVTLELEPMARLRLNFYGPRETFLHVSAGDLIHLAGVDQISSLPQDDPRRMACEAVRERLVLVGATSIGVFDMRPMPFDELYPGVELHATFLENVISGQVMRRPQQFWFVEIAFLLGLGLFLSWLLGRIRLTIGLVVVLAVMATAAAGDYLLFRANLMAHGVLVHLFVVVHFIAVAVWRYATEEREKTRIRHAFQFYLSNEVIEEILRDTKMLKLGGERRVLTVMFSDIRGFTSLSEKLDPAELTELLNEYLTPMTEIVLQQRGTLDKYIGDALMAFFGAPIAFEHHAHAACRSALQMMEQLKQLNEQWKQRGLPELAIGIGINTGEVSVGNMGSARRFDYTVIGDNVNLASRLEGLNKTYGTSIIISQFTREAIGGHFTCRKLDSVRVKGKRQPVDIYELVRAGPMDEERDGWIVLFERGLELYRNADFEKALEIFEQLKQDPAAGLFLQRCRRLMESPPPEGWDGVYTATTK